jgi:hypothetical protein
MLWILSCEKAHYLVIDLIYKIAESKGTFMWNKLKTNRQLLKKTTSMEFVMIFIKNVEQCYFDR